MARYTLIAIAALVAYVIVWSLVNVEEEAPIADDAARVPLAERHGALLDEIVFTREKARGQITELVASGSHQLAAQGISDVTTFRRIRDSARLAYDTSYGSSSELTLNVAGPEFSDGTLNPFHARAFREALNWLVDRRHIAEEIYGGLAVPRYVALNTAFPDSARLAATVRRLEVEYGHNPARARAVMERELIRMGARRIGGIWHQDGTPLTIRVLIRIEDQRRLVGDYIADLLQDFGLHVERLYRSADEASRVWLAGDPFAGQWHVYTGGWVAPQINRDLAAIFNFYYTPRGRPGGLWQAYHPAPELDDISDRLARRQYSSWEERQAMMSRALQLSMQDAAHIWLVDQVSAWVRSPDVSLAVDLAGGVVSSALWPFTLRYNSRTGGRMKIAMPGLLGEPYNPIAGTNWTFDLMVIDALQDVPVLPDPYTGLQLPQQVTSAQVTVLRDQVVRQTHDWVSLEHADEIQVPADTWVDWDVEHGRWVTAAERHPDGLTSGARVRIHYARDFLQRRWHDGSRRSLADLVIGWILTHERASPESPLFDASLVPAFELFRKSYDGFRIASRDPLVLEVYGGPVFPDAEVLAGSRMPGLRGTSGIANISAPWHTLALAIRAESQGELALSSTKADLQRIEWTNLVDGPSVQILRRHLDQARASNYLPFSRALEPFVEPGEVQARYAALDRWYAERGHFWVGDGPYYLHAVHAVEGSVVVRASPYYREPANKWLRFDTPRIPAVDIDGPMITPLGEPAVFDIDVRFDAKPYPDSDIEQVQYLLFDGNGELAASGSATAVGAGRWQVALEAARLDALGVGGNRLDVAVIARPVALPTFASHEFAIVPGETIGQSESTVSAR